MSAVAATAPVGAAFAALSAASGAVVVAPADALSPLDVWDEPCCHSVLTVVAVGRALLICNALRGNLSALTARYRASGTCDQSSPVCCPIVCEGNPGATLRRRSSPRRQLRLPQHQPHGSRPPGARPVSMHRGISCLATGRCNTAVARICCAIALLRPLVSSRQDNPSYALKLCSTFCKIYSVK